MASGKYKELKKAFHGRFHSDESRMWYQRESGRIELETRGESIRID